MSIKSKVIFITGGAGFIGSSFLREALRNNYFCVVVDKLTYAGRLENIQDCLDSYPDQIRFEKVDICDDVSLPILFEKYQPSGLIHFAAESHVDHSITDPKVFIETNILGTFNLLENSRKYLADLLAGQKKTSETTAVFKFLHVSTDEVFGELGETGFFSEVSSYRPNSPYSASKASGDHLVRSWFKTYGLPVLITNSSNNYGQRQYPEKLIPKTILKAITNQKISVYGNGLNIRDWIHVDDYCMGILLTFEKGQIGESYCFGGNSERKNIDVVNVICDILDKKKPRHDGQSYKKQIQFIEDRPGHDKRYAIDDTKAQKELGFERKYSVFEQGLEATIDWYLNNEKWVQIFLDGATRVESRGES